MGDALDKLVALAGTVSVKSYKRTTKSGKVVDVDAHTRSPADMSDSELTNALKNWWGKGEGSAPEDMSYNQKANIYKQIVSEHRSRGLTTITKGGPGIGNDPNHPSWEAKPYRPAAKKPGGVAGDLSKKSDDQIMKTLNNRSFEPAAKANQVEDEYRAEAKKRGIEYIEAKGTWKKSDSGKSKTPAMDKLAAAKDAAPAKFKNPTWAQTQDLKYGKKDADGNVEVVKGGKSIGKVRNYAGQGWVADLPDGTSVDATEEFPKKRAFYKNRDLAAKALIEKLGLDPVFSYDK